MPLAYTLPRSQPSHNPSPLRTRPSPSRTLPPPRSNTSPQVSRYSPLQQPLDPNLACVLSTSIQEDSPQLRPRTLSAVFTQTPLNGQSRRRASDVPKHFPTRRFRNLSDSSTPSSPGSSPSSPMDSSRSPTFSPSRSSFSAVSASFSPSSVSSISSRRSSSQFRGGSPIKNVPEENEPESFQLPGCRSPIMRGIRHSTILGSSTPPMSSTPMSLQALESIQLPPLDLLEARSSRKDSGIFEMDLTDQEIRPETTQTDQQEMMNQGLDSQGSISQQERNTRRTSVRAGRQPRQAKSNSPTRKFFPKQQHTLPSPLRRSSGARPSTGVPRSRSWKEEKGGKKMWSLKDIEILTQKMESVVQGSETSTLTLLGLPSGIWSCVLCYCDAGAMGDFACVSVVTQRMMQLPVVLSQLLQCLTEQAQRPISSEVTEKAIELHRRAEIVMQTINPAEIKAITSLPISPKPALLATLVIEACLTALGDDPVNMFKRPASPFFLRDLNNVDYLHIPLSTLTRLREILSVPELNEETLQQVSSCAVSLYRWLWLVVEYAILSRGQELRFAGLSLVCTEFSNRFRKWEDTKKQHPKSTRKRSSLLESPKGIVPKTPMTPSTQLRKETTPPASPILSPQRRHR